jgi:hypothetical protein
MFKMFDQRGGHIGQNTTAVPTHTKINKWKRTKVVTTWTPRKQTSVYPVSTIMKAVQTSF